MGAIYKKEVRSYFNSMIGYVLVAVLSAVIALYTGILNFYNGYPTFAVSLYSTSVFLIVVIPILSMRSFAEERKTKTDQMLLTYPISVTKIVLGKFFALATVFAVPMLICCVYPLILLTTGNCNPVVDYSTILCYFLLGCMYLAIGIFISAHTENQIISAVITVVVLFLLYNIETITSVLPSASRYNLAILIGVIAVVALWLWFSTRSYIIALGFACVCVVASVVVYKIKMTLFASLITNVLTLIDVNNVLTNFAGYEEFDLAGIVLIVSITALFLFLTVQSVSKRRWN